MVVTSEDTKSDVVENIPAVATEVLREIDYKKIKTIKDVSLIFSASGITDGIAKIQDLKDYFYSVGREIDIKTVGDARLVLQVLGGAFNVDHPYLQDDNENKKHFESLLKTEILDEEVKGV